MQLPGSQGYIILAQCVGAEGKVYAFDIQEQRLKLRENY